jgi:CRP/FNR family cyclic AMP-dependent transcriptional regulator
LPLSGGTVIATFAGSERDVAARSASPDPQYRARDARSVSRIWGFRREAAAHHEEAAEVLGSTHLFSALDRRSLLSLAGIGRQRTYGRGQYLWYQGDPGEHLVVVCKGLLKVVLTSDQGEEIVLVTLGRHEVVGELAILDGMPRSASVVAVEPTTALILPRAAVLELIGAHPAVLDAVLRSLGQLVRRFTEQTGGLVFLDLPGRIAKVLLQLAQTHARDDHRMVVDVGLSQCDIAAMVGATRPAVNRILHLFASRGLISVEGRVIVIRDPSVLRRRASS